MSCMRRRMKTEHLVERAFFSVLSVSRRICVVPLRTSKVIHSQHVSSTTPRRAWPMSIILFHATSFYIDSTAYDWNQETPGLLHQEDCCLAIWLTQLLSWAQDLHWRQQWAHAEQLHLEEIQLQYWAQRPYHPPKTPMVFSSQRQPAAARIKHHQVWRGLVVQHQETGAR